VEHARDEQSCLRKLSDTSPVILEESGRVSTLVEHPGIKLPVNFQFMPNNVCSVHAEHRRTTYTKLQNFSQTFLTELFNQFLPQTECNLCVSVCCVFVRESSCGTEHAASSKSETKNNIQRLEIQMPQVCANIR